MRPAGRIRLFDVNVSGRGQRVSAARGYLRDAPGSKPTILTNTFARKVVIQNGRAVGDEVTRDGQVEVIRANREVVLSAGAINSPCLLWLSGIGPARSCKNWV